MEIVTPDRYHPCSFCGGSNHPVLALGNCYVEESTYKVCICSKCAHDAYTELTIAAYLQKMFGRITA